MHCEDQLYYHIVKFYFFVISRIFLGVQKYQIQFNYGIGFYNNRISEFQHNDKISDRQTKS